MGGGGSKPAPPPTVIEEEPPAGSGEMSIVYPNRPETPRLDGITRSIANECNNCSLQVVSGVSSSSVKVSRDYGVISENQCRKYSNDLKRVRNKEFSFQDFLNNLQSGQYLRNLNNGYCEQVELSSEDAAKTTKIEDFNEGQLRSVRIQQISSGGFSADTKAKFTPSIPFRLKFSTAGSGEVEITVKTMSLYHPCPIRLEGVQPDAVLSLNDPAFDNPNYVILVPLVGRNLPSPSVGFLEKIMSQVVSVSEPDPSSGQYVGKDIATGANWTLGQLFGTKVAGTGNFEVTDGFYEWKGMPALERKREDGNNTITYKWVESGKPVPRYIMLDTPVVCNPADLAVLTQRMPVTPPMDAVHAVLYSSNPFQRGIVHKQGPANCSTSREAFTDLQGVTEETSDPWTIWAQTARNGFSTQQIFDVMFQSLVFVAMAVGAYLALSAVLRMYDVEVADLSKGIGKVSAVFFKTIQQKASLKNIGIGALKDMGTISTKDSGIGMLKDVGTTGTGLLKDLESGLLKDVDSTPTTNTEDPKTNTKAKMSSTDYLKGFKPPGVRGGN